MRCMLMDISVNHASDSLLYVKTVPRYIGSRSNAAAMPRHRTVSLHGQSDLASGATAVQGSRFPGCAGEHLSTRCLCPSPVRLQRLHRAGAMPLPSMLRAHSSTWLSQWAFACCTSAPLGSQSSTDQPAGLPSL